MGHRVKAARHYRGLDQKKAAKKMRVEPATLGRYEKGLIPDIKRPGVIKRSAKAMNLPEEFFSVDFNELPRMVRLLHKANGGPTTGPTPGEDAPPPPNFLRHLPPDDDEALDESA